MYTASFYVSHAPQEPLAWRQHLHNVGAELLRFPFVHKHYDLIDAKTFERHRVTSTVNAGNLLELIVKVLFAATLVIPIVCFAISYPTASQRSWRQVDILFGQLDKEHKKDFLYAFLTKKEIEKESPFAGLHLIAESYRKGGFEADLLCQWIRLDASAFEEVKQWGDAHETIYIAADSYVRQHNSQITVLYPFLTAVDQIRILQQLQAREKDLLKLFPLSATAALENPGQLLHCLIPIELHPSVYGITLKGLPDLHHTARDLQERIPKTYQAIEALLMTLPQASVLGIFWKVAKTIRPGIWEQNRKVTVDNLSPEEANAVRTLPFEEVLLLHQFKQPWTELWYRVGQTSERLRQACFSLSHDNENSYRQEENREKFLDFLSHEDLRDLITEDPNCVNLAKIFGNQREPDYPETKPLKWVEIPRALMCWWNLYEKVDYLQRWSELSAFCTNDFFLRYLEARHYSYIKMKPGLDEFRRRWDEQMKPAKEYTEYLRARIGQRKSPEDFERWQRANRAKEEWERARRELLLTFKTNLEGMGLDPKRAYTREEVSREFRRWSVTHHPDKDSTQGATERFQQYSRCRDTVVSLLAMKGYSKTLTC
jgi:hypothetical protein